jgi:hypothetical protein
MGRREWVSEKLTMGINIFCSVLLYGKDARVCCCAFLTKKLFPVRGMEKIKDEKKTHRLIQNA